MIAIDINHLVKEYKNGVRALDSLNLTVNSGEIFSLLGPNGAGKSSLINILTTYYKPTSGKVTMLGEDLLKVPAMIRTQIACVAQQVSIDNHLTLMENMIFQSKLYRVDAQTAKKRIQTLIEAFDLSRYLKHPTSSYSGGVKRRLDIAMNMVSSPKILFLDEPTVGMDANSRIAMWKMLQRIRDEYGTTIFLTTHYLEEADELSDRICIMKSGKEIVQGTPSHLRQYIRQNMLRIGFRNTNDAVSSKTHLKKLRLIQHANIRNHSLFVHVDDQTKSFNTISRWLLDQEMAFEAIEIVEPNLEDIFLTLTDSAHGRKEV